MSVPVYDGAAGVRVAADGLHTGELVGQVWTGTPPFLLLLLCSLCSEGDAADGKVTMKILAVAALLHLFSSVTGELLIKTGAAR